MWRSRARDIGRVKWNSETVGALKFTSSLGAITDRSSPAAAAAAAATVACQRAMLALPNFITLPTDAEI